MDRKKGKILDMETFAAEIRQAILEKQARYGITQLDIQRTHHLSTRTIYHFLRGDTVSSASIQKLCDWLNDRPYWDSMSLLRAQRQQAQQAPPPEDV